MRISDWSSDVCSSDLIVPEARLWNDVFNHAEDKLGIKRGTIKATVLIETILATFEMDEILYELRDHSAGLNCGRWDYIFSCIKKFRHRPEIGIASCRERGCQYVYIEVVAVSLKKKNSDL